MLPIVKLSLQDVKRGLLVALTLFCIFQLAAFIGQVAGGWGTINSALDRVEKRISLDLAYLDVGSEALGTPVNESAVLRYMERLNEQLQLQSFPLSILSIQKVHSGYPVPDRFGAKRRLTMDTAEQHVRVSVAVPAPWQYITFSPLSFVGALVIAPLVVGLRRQKRQRNQRAVEAAPASPKLVIDMVTKSIGNGIDERLVPMQNKPFCFYTALVKYCISHPDKSLLQHQDIPLDLINIANKVFSRLTELGHTKRKRPDFNANLDKTLSEIRAALDDAFAGYPAQKARYYPPRAQGEGSRSKQHSFALTGIHLNDIEIRGN